MKDPANRDMMAKLYRLVEKYEEPFVAHTIDEAHNYFVGITKDLTAALGPYEGNEFADAFWVAFYEAIEAKYKKANKAPLSD